MPKLKEKVIERIEPGSEVIVKCYGECGESLTLKPSDKCVLPKKVEYICADCGISTKWKHQEAKADQVQDIPPGQTRLDGGRKK